MKDDNSCIRVDTNEELIKSEKENIVLKTDVFVKNAKFHALLGNETRLKIIYLLFKHEKLCVCDISDILSMSQSPVSQHLRKLKDFNILISKREGLLINYYISDEYRDKIAIFFDDGLKFF